MEERIQTGANKWRKGLFEERNVDEDGDEHMRDQNWRSEAPAKSHLGTGYRRGRGIGG